MRGSPAWLPLGPVTSSSQSWPCLAAERDPVWRGLSHPQRLWSVPALEAEKTGRVLLVPGNPRTPRPRTDAREKEGAPLGRSLDTECLTTTA